MKDRLPLIEDFADIGEFMDQQVKIYSSGMFVRLAFATAISVDPDILVVDEALAVGDVKFQAKCFMRFRDFQKQGKSILLVSHDRSMITRLCDKAIVLENGAIHHAGDPFSAVNHYDRLLFGQRKVSISVPDRIGESKEKTDTCLMDDELNEFFGKKSIEVRLHKRKSYNPNHFRMGDGRAKVLDYLIVNDGNVDPVKVLRKSQVSLFIKFLFLDDVRNPLFGFGIHTLDGIQICGTNTNMMNLALDRIDKETVVIVRCEFANLMLTHSYLFNFGVAEETSEGTCFVEVLRGAACVEVFGEEKADGLADLSCAIEKYDSYALGEV
jgi:lipopolysaccharide transport system ATP-binding protein